MPPPDTHSHTTVVFSRVERGLHKALGVRESYHPLSLHSLHHRPLQGSQWPAGQPATATASTPRVTGRLSETCSSGNSGLTRATSDIHWQARQLIKIRKKYSTSFKHCYEPKKKITCGIIKISNRTSILSHSSYSLFYLGHH